MTIKSALKYEILDLRLWIGGRQSGYGVSDRVQTLAVCKHHPTHSNSDQPRLTHLNSVPTQINSLKPALTQLNSYKKYFLNESSVSNMNLEGSNEIHSGNSRGDVASR